MSAELFLECKACGHWASGPFTRDELHDWLRVHRSAMVGEQKCPPYGFVRESSCPTPCGEVAFPTKARLLIVWADSLLSLVHYRGVGALDDEWREDAKNLLPRLREFSKAPPVRARIEEEKPDDTVR